MLLSSSVLREGTLFMYILLTIIIAIVSIIIILAVLFQQSKSYGLSSSIGGGNGPQQSYWSKNKSRSREGKLKRATIIAGIVFFVAAILLNVSALTTITFESTASEEEVETEVEDETDADTETDDDTDSEEETE